MMDLTQLSILELMRLNQFTLDELERREIIRTRNQPTSEYTEWLVATRMSMALASPSTKGYDAVTLEGRKVQIKSRKNNLKNKSMILGIIRNYELNQFDDLIAVIYNHDFTIRLALNIPHELVQEYGFYNAHQNGYTLTISNSLIEDVRVIDIRNKLIDEVGSNEEAISIDTSLGIERDLQTVGMLTFVEYYKYFLNEVSSIEMIELMLTDHSTWKEGTARTKISTMKRIFKNGNNIDALNLVLDSKHPLITDSVKDLVISLMR